MSLTVKTVLHNDWCVMFFATLWSVGLFFGQIRQFLQSNVVCNVQGPLGTMEKLLVFVPVNSGAVKLYQLTVFVYKEFLLVSVVPA